MESIRFFRITEPVNSSEFIGDTVIGLQIILARVSFPLAVIVFFSQFISIIKKRLRKKRWIRKKFKKTIKIVSKNKFPISFM